MLMVTVGIRLICTIVYTISPLRSVYFPKVNVCKIIRDRISLGGKGTHEHAYEGEGNRFFAGGLGVDGVGSRRDQMDVQKC